MSIDDPAPKLPSRQESGSPRRLLQQVLKNVVKQRVPLIFLQEPVSPVERQPERRYPGDACDGEGGALASRAIGGRGITGAATGSPDVLGRGRHSDLRPA